MDWKDIKTAPDSGQYFVKGGHYNSAYSQMHGMQQFSETLIEFRVQINPDVDPPYRVVGEQGMGIDSPTHWASKQ